MESPAETASIEIGESGVHLAYSDSGVPADPGYVTIFAVHGTGFSRAAFDKVSSIAPKAGLRIVSIARRNYPGSSMYTEEEREIIVNGTNKQKQALLDTLGRELAIFYFLFVQKHNIPSISQDGKAGGIVLLGWSSGCTPTLAAISQIEYLPEDARTHLASCVTTVILQDAAPHTLGLPAPRTSWTPLVDTTIPEKDRLSAFTFWGTSYFTHGDLSTRSESALSFYLPSTSRVPSIYSMPQEVIIPASFAMADRSLVLSCSSHLGATFRKAIFSEKVRKEVLPHMKAWLVAGDRTMWTGVAGMWAVQDEDKQRGGGFIECKLIPGGNHFMQWDEPDMVIQVYLDCINSRL